MTTSQKSAIQTSFLPTAIGRLTLVAMAVIACNLLMVNQLMAADEDDATSAKVATVFQKYCASCHSGNDPEGDVLLSSLRQIRSGKTQSGPFVTAGKPEQSLVYSLITGDVQPKMPPDGEPQPSAEDVELVKRWIADGAKVVDHPSSMKAAPKPNSNSHTSAVAQLSDGRVVLGRFGKVEISQLGDSPAKEVSGLAGKVTSLRLSPNGKWLLIGSGRVGVEGEVAIVDVATLQIVKRLSGHTDVVYTAAMSADGKWIASGSYDRKVILWNVENDQPAVQITGHNGAIYDLDFDPTSRILATASGDQTVKLWSIPDGARLDTLGQPEGEMRCVRFSNDGKFLYAAGADRQIRQWLVDPSATAGSPMLLARYAHEREVLRMSLLDDQALITASADGTVKAWTQNDLLPLGELTTTKSLPIGICSLGSKSGDKFDVVIVDLEGNRSKASFESIVQRLKLSRVKTSPTLAAPANPAVPTKSLPVEKIAEAEPNNSPENAQPINLPVEISGVIHVTAGNMIAGNSTASGNEAKQLATAISDTASDADLFRFQAKVGQTWIIEVFAATEKSALDSFIDVLDEHGQPVLQTRLQALRESYFTFRGKDSSTSDDFRLHKWQDMELDEFLYSHGEVVRLWLYPRGPDSGFKVYPGAEARYTFFGTTPVAHALGESAYVVRPLSHDETPLPNGLPVFPIYFENDDDPLRERGADSRLTFQAPADGSYLLRIRDARGFSSENQRYRVVAREPNPDFKLSFGKLDLAVAKGTGLEWSVKAKRLDDLQDEIAIELHGLPDGVQATNPLIIGAGQLSALGNIYASPEAAVTTEPIEIRLVAKCVPRGGATVIEKELPERIKLSINENKQPRVALVSRTNEAEELQELTIRPGQTISAALRVDRNGFEGGVSFGKEDSGRNLPHGCFVDNIGLSGLLIVEGQSSREVFITAAPKVVPGRYQFHFRTELKGNPTTKPIWLNVVKP